MKTRQYLESLVTQGYNSHGSMYYEVDKKKFKFTYEHGNCYERFRIELFDGDKLNPIATLSDLNEKKTPSAYLMTDVETKNRVAKLNEKAKKYVETLITINYPV